MIQTDSVKQSRKRSDKHKKAPPKKTPGCWRRLAVLFKCLFLMSDAAERTSCGVFTIKACHTLSNMIGQHFHSICPKLNVSFSVFPILYLFRTGTCWFLMGQNPQFLFQQIKSNLPALQGFPLVSVQVYSEQQWLWFSW